MSTAPTGSTGPPADPSPAGVAALNRATYDRIAAAYADRTSRRHGDFLGGLRSRFTAAVPKGGIVLDVGCGPGHLLPGFAAAWLRPVGVEPSSAMRATALGSGAPLVGADMAALPFADASVDGIWCQAALLHVPESSTAAVLAGFARVLRPGGQLGLVTATGSGARLEEVAYEPGLYRWFVYREPQPLRAALERAGFTVRAEVREDGARSWVGLHADLPS